MVRLETTGQQVPRGRVAKDKLIIENLANYMGGWSTSRPDIKCLEHGGTFFPREREHMLTGEVHESMDMNFIRTAKMQEHIVLGIPPRPF
jgi:hypothetical protein